MPQNEQCPLLNLINILPLQSIKRETYSSQEIDDLYSIWKKYAKEDGSIDPQIIKEPLNILSLITKGLLEKRKTANIFGRTFEITDQGRKIIRSLILKDQQSAFETNNSLDGMSKSASKRINLKIKQNWLTRATNNS